jgi:hypothetical protein
MAGKFMMFRVFGFWGPPSAGDLPLLFQAPGPYSRGMSSPRRSTWLAILLYLLALFLFDAMALVIKRLQRRRAFGLSQPLRADPGGAVVA